ncbi:MAG: phosphatidylcholine/phosphatidylserine synthase [Planctomycetes bacterium]|nr:phosphatidylcholine/phosphatidylserine synthase [Planctomycetota bacterium]MBI3834360.1 phosphatidylcholine/phosphatidylserine synthase [Planctomycetota bacterium]
MRPLNRTSKPEEFKTGILRRRRRLRSLAFVPTLVTLGNLVCGFAAIHFALRATYDLGAGVGPEHVLTLSSRILERMLPSFLSVGAGLVLLGMILDGFDGLLARVTQSTTNFGGQLDSLADVVTFGVAPATLVVAFMTKELAGSSIVPSPISEHALGRFTWVSAAAYVAFTAMRLARYNVEHAEAGHDYKTFRGLPSPGAALIMVSLIFLQDQPITGAFRVWIKDATPILVTCIGFLMVSRIPYRRLSRAYLVGRQPFGQFMFVIAVLLVFISFPAPTLITASMLYGLSGPLWYVYRLARGRGFASSPPAATHGEMADSSDEKRQRA